MHRNQVDKNGYAPDWDLIGSTWMHSVRRSVYTLTDFDWNCDRDVWNVRYLPVGSPTSVIHYNRSAEYFFGMNADEEPRFVRL